MQTTTTGEGFDAALKLATLGEVGGTMAVHHKASATPDGSTQMTLLTFEAIGGQRVRYTLSEKELKELTGALSQKASDPQATETEPSPASEVSSEDEEEEASSLSGTSWPS